MTVLDGQVVVYSLGADGKDDGAKVDWADGKRPGDFLFRLPSGRN